MCFYELVTCDPIDNFWHYYYFHSNATGAFGEDFCPAKLWQIKEDYAEEWLEVYRISFFRYIWCKYFKRQGTFGITNGIRVDWEKC